MRPKIAVIMGSESDAPVMNKACETLKGLGIEYRATVASAHRSPGLAEEFIAAAEKEGVQVFIAGAGGAAHLAGVIAGRTVKPVIGVPLASKLAGFDSLLSTVQMPRGVPVATVAVDGAENAALLAAQILALADPDLAQILTDHRKDMAEAIVQQAKRMADSGGA